MSVCLSVYLTIYRERLVCIVPYREHKTGQVRTLPPKACNLASDKEKPGKEVIRMIRMQAMGLLVHVLSGQV